jgi:hypothetical protein
MENTTEIIREAMAINTIDICNSLFEIKKEILENGESLNETIDETKYQLCRELTQINNALSYANKKDPTPNQKEISFYYRLRKKTFKVGEFITHKSYAEPLCIDTIILANSNDVCIVCKFEQPEKRFYKLILFQYPNARAIKSVAELRVQEGTLRTGLHFYPNV